MTVSILYRGLEIDGRVIFGHEGDFNVPGGVRWVTDVEIISATAWDDNIIDMLNDKAIDDISNKIIERARM